MSKKITMTIPQFLSYERGELTLKEIKEINKADLFIGDLMKDKRISKVLIFTTACLNIANKVLASTEDALNKVDSVGAEFLSIIQRVGFWICLIGCILEILIAVFKKGGGKNEVLSTIFKWLIIFSSFYFLPAIFRFIAAAFQ
ncbi:hypothetical protein [Clostridium tertium]|uniref:hypothetical protein n=1 Tax=Clostridium tertium TaxID=1559 RepID=UPI001AE716CA|nr:hypothetical protein [Clostridium tertium]MBP1869040.1 hypothetical protein [Clostridium tertium]